MRSYKTHCTSGILDYIGEKPENIPEILCSVPNLIHYRTRAGDCKGISFDTISSATASSYIGYLQKWERGIRWTEGWGTLYPIWMHYKASYTFKEESYVFFPEAPHSSAWELYCNRHQSLALPTYRSILTKSSRSTSHFMSLFCLPEVLASSLQHCFSLFGEHCSVQCVTTLSSASEVQIHTWHPRDDCIICVSGPRHSKCCVSTQHTHPHCSPLKQRCSLHFAVRRMHHLLCLWSAEKPCGKAGYWALATD